MLFAVRGNELNDIPKILDWLNAVAQYKSTSEECAYGVDGYENEEEQKRIVIKKRIREPADSNGNDAGNKLR